MANGMEKEDDVAQFVESAVRACDGEDVDVVFELGAMVDQSLDEIVKRNANRANFDAVAAIDPGVLKKFTSLTSRALTSSPDSPLVVDLCHLYRLFSRDQKVITMVIDAHFVEVADKTLNDYVESMWEEGGCAKAEVCVELLKTFTNACFHSPSARALISDEKYIASVIARLGYLGQNADKFAILRSTSKSQLFTAVRDTLAPLDGHHFDLVVNHVRLLFMMTATVHNLQARCYTESCITPLYQLTRVCLPIDGAQLTINTEQVQLLVEILKLLFNLACSRANSKEDGKDELYARTTDMCIGYCRYALPRLAEHMPALVDDKQLRPRQAAQQSDAEQQSMTLSTNLCNLLTIIPPERLDSLTLMGGGERNMATIDAVLKMTKYHFVTTTCPKHYESQGGCEQHCVYLRAPLGERRVDTLVPLIGLLHNIASTPTDRHRQYLRRIILPKLCLADAEHRPEQGNTLRAHLVRLLTCVHTNLSSNAGRLMLVLCKNSVDRLVKHTGYGNACGLLAATGRMGGGGGDVSEGDSSEDEDEEYTEVANQINPVLGCKDNAEMMARHKEWLDSMSDEQKEYEADKLMKQMDKLLSAGVIRPATIGPDGTPQVVSHVLEMADKYAQQEENKKTGDDED